MIKMAAWWKDYRWTATVNTPGYLPMADEPAVFDDPVAAWDYLLDERQRDEDGLADGEDYSEDYYRLEDMAVSVQRGLVSTPADTLYLSTPGSDSPHDLGLAYSVDVFTET